jgi:integrase
MREGTNWNLSNPKKITEAQYEKVLDAASYSPRDWMLIFLAGNLGLRISEVLHLRASDFDPTTGAVRVIRRKKRDLQAEALDVADEIFPFVQQYIEDQKIGAKNWLFSGGCKPCWRKWKGQRQKICSGGHLTVRYAEKVWDRLTEKTGIKVPGRGIHSLRHFDATRYYERTRDLRATQKHLGHFSPLITQVYADVVEMKERANKVGISIGKSPFKGTPKRDQ